MRIPRDPLDGRSDGSAEPRPSAPLSEAAVPPVASSRRSSRRTPKLYDYGAIGNLRTAALVSRFGGLDWACLPRFASPSVFARLLDARLGGGFEVAPEAVYESEQTYLPSTNVLLTRFALPGDRQLDLIDFMPIVDDSVSEDPGSIVRIAQARGGPVELRVVVHPRFRYGAEPGVWAPADGGFVARGPEEDRLWVRSRGPLAIRQDRLVGRFELSEGARWWAEAGWGEPPAGRSSAEELLRATTRFWQSWVHPPTTPIHRIAGMWHDAVERSELVLKLLSIEEVGAFVAAPTTSLPEWPGGTRNWDYRYVWIRDAAFSAQALLLLGHFTEAERFLTWVVDRLSAPGAGASLRVLYGGPEGTDLTERELPHLEGFQGSRPVRVGNAAESQFQLDIYGELLDAARLMAVRRQAAVRPYWPRLAQLTEWVVRDWSLPDRGMWEARSPPRPYVHSKLMAWVALDRSIDLAARFGDEQAVARWTPARAAVRAWMLREGYSERLGSFVQAAGEEEIDAANLRIPLLGFLPFDDPRVKGTVERIRTELSVGPFVRRYRTPDGIDGPEGTFLPAAFWMVECLARLGQRRQALAHWRRLLLAASPLGLFPEEYDAERGRPLGNFPQAFTHIGVLRAAIALGASEMPDLLLPTFVR